MSAEKPPSRRFPWEADSDPAAPETEQSETGTWQPPFPRHRPWRYWKSMPGEGGWPAPKEWPPLEMRKRRQLFLLFARFLVLSVVGVLAGVGALAYLFTRFFNGPAQTTWAVWLSGCGLAVALPLAAAFITFRSMRRVVNPLARVMAAADAVAEGDLSVRVPEGGPAEFGQMVRSFNRMVAELERADLLRRNLTADVAHELRTPLHIIQGNLEGILDGVYQPTPEQVNLLLDETHLLARLVEDLRTLSLAEAGQLPLRRELIVVRELLSDLATSFSGQAEAAGVTLTVDPGPEGLTLWGDADRIDQVLTNLVANALRHTPAGGTIRLGAAALDDSVRLQVSDNGSGIAPEELPFIFDRFYRGGNAGREMGGLSGSGLGLAIARQLVQAHDGQISVESLPGQGATFTVDLPVGESRE
jgi:two-component system, OmpR family, sensor histidine kinase BaeS